MRACQTEKTAEAMVLATYGPICRRCASPLDGRQHFLLTGLSKLALILFQG